MDFEKFFAGEKVVLPETFDFKKFFTLCKNHTTEKQLWPYFFAKTSVTYRKVLAECFPRMFVGEGLLEYLNRCELSYAVQVPKWKPQAAEPEYN